MRAVFFTSSLIALAMPAASPAVAAMDYASCVDLVARDARTAVKEAGAWARFGGGAGARHCYALALVAAGATLKGAAEMIALARTEPGLTSAARSDLLAQAGELLLEAGDAATATRVAGQAIKLAPGSPRALGLRAAVRLRDDKARAAIADLDTAIKAGKPSARLLSLRAAAHRRLGKTTSARADSLFALEIDAKYAPAWIERGRAEAKLGDRHNARQSFLKAIALDRNGRLGATARRALQRMEAGLGD